MNFDTLYYNFNKSKLLAQDEDVSWKKEVIIQDKSPVTWVCFLGWKNTVELAKKLHFLPTIGTVVVYQVPNNIVNKNPNGALISLRIIEADANQYFMHGRQTRILSMSLGNMFGFYYANKFNVEKFISVITTRKLGENIWQSCATENIKNESVALGFDMNEYDRIVYDYNCINNIDNLPENTLIYYAHNDSYMPTKNQIAFIQEVKKYNKPIKTVGFSSGHILSHLYFGFLNRIGKIEW